MVHVHMFTYTRAHMAFTLYLYMLVHTFMYTTDIHTCSPAVCSSSHVPCSFDIFCAHMILCTHFGAQMLSGTYDYVQVYIIQAHTYSYIFVQTYIHFCAHILIHFCAHILEYIFVHTYIHFRAHILTFIFVHTYSYIFVHTFSHTFSCTHIYSYIFAHTFSHASNIFVIFFDMYF